MIREIIIILRWPHLKANNTGNYYCLYNTSCVIYDIIDCVMFTQTRTMYSDDDDEASIEILRLSSDMLSKLLSLDSW